MPAVSLGIPVPLATCRTPSIPVHALSGTETPRPGIFPDLAILLAVASTNFLGEGLRIDLDPRLR